MAADAMVEALGGKGNVAILDHAVVESPPEIRRHVIDWLGAIAGNDADMVQR